MSHAALVADGLFCFVVALVVLLVMFSSAVIRMSPEPAASASQPAPRPAGAQAGADASAGAAGHSRYGGYAARHAAPATPSQGVTEPGQGSGGPPWEPAPAPPSLGGAAAADAVSDARHIGGSVRSLSAAWRA
jgi:hypothetical protein